MVAVRLVSVCVVPFARLSTKRMTPIKLPFPRLTFTARQIPSSDPGSRFRRHLPGSEGLLPGSRFASS
eukprot:3662692-Rhodomonas_salina.1